MGELKGSEWEQRMAARQAALLDKALDPSFLTAEGASIAEHLNNLIAPEVHLAQARPELFVLPSSTRIAVYDKVPPDDMLILEIAARDFVTGYTDHERDFRVEFSHTEKPRTGLVFRATPSVLKQNRWLCFGIEVGSQDTTAWLKLELRNTVTGLKVQVHEDSQTRQEQKELTERITGEEIPEAEYRVLVGKSDFSNLDLLAQFINDPHSLAKIFPKEKMMAVPQRVMTQDEYEDWCQTVSGIQSPMRKILHDGSSEEYTVQEDELSGLYTIRERWLDTNNDFKGEEVLYIPVAVENGEGGRIGFLISEVINFPGYPLKARFNHGAKTIERFKQK